MAGARSEKFGTIFRRLDGMLKSGALRWEERPVWYDVYKAFPPKVEPKFEREVPDQYVRNILYPEDFVRAKFTKQFYNADIVDLKDSETKTVSQVFVEKYFEMKNDMKNKGASEDDLFEAVTRSLRLSGINLRVKIDNEDSCHSVIKIDNLIHNQLLAEALLTSEMRRYISIYTKVKAGIIGKIKIRRMIAVMLKFENKTMIYHKC